MTASLPAMPGSVDLAPGLMNSLDQTRHLHVLSGVSLVVPSSTQQARQPPLGRPRFPGSHRWGDSGFLSPGCPSVLVQSMLGGTSQLRPVPLCPAPCCCPLLPSWAFFLQTQNLRAISGSHLVVSKACCPRSVCSFLTFFSSALGIAWKVDSRQHLGKHTLRRGRLAPASKWGLLR